jgi:toxin secretion/phage lysis holin
MDNFDIDWEQAFNVLKHISSNYFIILLFTVIIVDIITGLLSATKQKNLNSTLGTKGMNKHVTVILLSVVLYIVLTIGNIGKYADLIILFFIIQYVISIIENTSKLGIKYPTKLINLIYKLENEFTKEK